MVGRRSTQRVGSTLTTRLYKCFLGGTSLPFIIFLAFFPFRPVLAQSVGTGGAPGLLYGQYESTPPGLTNGQIAPFQVDQSGRLVVAPFSLIFGSPLQTYSASGVGADTVFPSTVSAVGTTLGTAPTGSSGVLIHLPPGASVSFYVASTVAANSTAAALLSETRNNPSTAVDNLDVAIPLNGQFIWITNYTSGTATAYVSGHPVFRFI
jgi:hypothetical protein